MPLLLSKDASLGDTTRCEFYQQLSVGGNYLRASGYFDSAFRQSIRMLIR